MKMKCFFVFFQHYVYGYPHFEEVEDLQRAFPSVEKSMVKRVLFGIFKPHRKPTTAGTIDGKTELKWSQNLFCQILGNS